MKDDAFSNSCAVTAFAQRRSITMSTTCLSESLNRGRFLNCLIPRVTTEGAPVVCRMCEICTQRVTWCRSLVSRSRHTHVVDILVLRSRHWSLSFADGDSSG